MKMLRNYALLLLLANIGPMYGYQEPPQRESNFVSSANSAVYPFRRASNFLEPEFWTTHLS